MVRSLVTRRWPRTLAVLLSVLLALYWLPSLGSSPARAATVGGFEIDGNQVTESAVDWQTASPTRSADAVGNTDTSVFSTGSHERNDPRTWEQNTTAGATGKEDIGLLLFALRADSGTGDQWAYFAWDRAFAQGTGSYYLELNQLPNQTSNDGKLSVPNRSPGDIRLEISDQGGGGMQVDGVATWNGSAWGTLAPVSGALDVAVNTAPITDYYSSPNAIGGTIGADQFIEVAINLTAYGLNQCPVSGFTALNLRSQTGNGALKDNATGTIAIPSNCAGLTIVKRDGNGAPIPGATFTISPNPLPAGTPGRPDATSIVIVDDADENTDLNGGTYDDPDARAGMITFPEVVPDVQYTVTETGVPTGYIGPAAAQTVTLGPSQPATLTFVNRLGSVSWEKRDATDNALLAGATFQVTATDGPAETLSVDRTVVDNGANDAAPDAGEFRVVDLPLGDYTVTETAAPTGYTLPTDPDQTFTVSADAPDVTLTTAFLDPRKPGAIQVTKLDDATDAPLAGATFQLYADHGTLGQLDDADVAVGEPRTVGSDGVASWSDLAWGHYLVVETQAPTGYRLPDPAAWPVTIDATNAGTTLAVQARDLHKLTEITVTKQDAAGATITSAPAQFGLYVDSDKDGTLDEGEPLLVTTFETNPQWTTTDGTATGTVDGTAAWTHLDFGSYMVRELAPPTGYDLPAARDHAFTVTTANAGGTLSATFRDPLSVTTLTVAKTGQQGSATEPVPGATFQLWKESNGVAGLQTTAVNETPADTLIDTGQTGTDGTLTLPAAGDSYTITWPATYYWVETAVPAPYNLPPQTVSDPIEVTQETIAEAFPVTTFADRVTTVATDAVVVDGTLPGAVVRDIVHLGNIPTATLSGEVTFTLYGPVTGDPPTPTCQTGSGGNVAATVTSTAFTMSDPDTAGYRTATAVSPDVTLTQAGTYYWVASFDSGTPGVRDATGACGDANETVTIHPAGVSISTQATGQAVYGGAPIGDAATLTGVTTTPKPTGAITFDLYGPTGDTPTCTGTPVYTHTVTIPADVVVSGSGDAASITVPIPTADRYVPAAPGTYYWIASYSGDANNAAVAGRCGDPGETTVVTRAGLDLSTSATEQALIRGPAAGGPDPISDIATLSWAGTGVTPTGSVTFSLYGPLDPDSTSCTGLTPTGQWTVPITEAMVHSDTGGSWIEVLSPQFLPTAPGTYRWSATYSGDNNYGTVTEPCTAEHETSLVSRPGVDKTADPQEGETVLVGETIHYTITVTNDGPAAVVDQPLVDTLPDHVTYNGDASPAATYDATAGTLTWDVDLPAGQSTTVTYSVTVQTDTPGGTDLENTATFVGYEDTTHHYAGVQEPSLDKSADPVSGSVVQPGQAITYTVTLGNTGTYPVTGDLVDQLPDWVTYSSVATGTPEPVYDADAGTLTWDGVTVAPDQTLTFVYTVTVADDVPAGTTLENEASYAGLTDSTRHSTGEPDTSVDKGSPNAGAIVPRGDTIHYTVTVANTGDYPVTSAALVDTLPAGVTYTTDSAVLASSTGGASLAAVPPEVGTGTPVTLTWTVTLPPGSSLTIGFDVTVDETASGTLVNTATFRGDQDAVEHVVGVPVPTLVKSASPASGSTVQPGQAITYTVTLGNTGNSPVSGPVVDTLPAQVNYVAGSADHTLVGAGAAVTGPVTGTSDGQETLTWQATVPAGGQVILTYQVLVDTDVAAGVSFHNHATWQGLTGETTHETGTPTPGLDKTSTPPSGELVERGSLISYTVTVSNTGDYPIVGAELVDTLPDAVTYVGTLGDTPAPTVSPDGGTLTWLVTLQPDQSTVFTYQVRVDADAAQGATLLNSALFRDITKTTTHVVGVPVPTLVKSASPASGSTVQPGQAITYTVTIGNTGNLPVTGQLVDTLPAQVSYSSVATGTPTPTYDAAAHTLTWPSVTLGAGQTKTYVYTVTVSPSTPDNSTLVNTATFLDLSASTTHRTGAPAGGPEKTADPPSGSVVQPGQTIVYTVTVTNTGSGPVRGQPAVDTLPDHVTLVPGSITGGGVPSADGRTITWSVSLAPGGSASYTYAVTVDADAPAGVDLVNRVTFLGVQDTTTHEVATGVLTVGKAVSPTGSAEFGDTLTYTLTVRANGTLDQTDVVVTDYLPGYDPARPASGTTTYVAGSATCDGTCTVTYDPATHLLTWALGTVPAGTTRVLTFRVVIDTPPAALDGSIPAVDILNAASVRSARVGPTPSNEVVTPVAAVAGIKVPAPQPPVQPLAQPPAQPPVAVGGVTLPPTGAGFPVGLSVGLGVLLVAAGTVVTLGVRRRQASVRAR